MLDMKLQFFAEGGEGAGTEGEGGQGQGNPEGEGGKAPEGKKEQMIPKSRFDEVNNGYKELKKQLDVLLAEKEKAEKESLKKQGKYEDLYKQANEKLIEYETNYSKASERVTELEGVVNQLLETKLETIPEEFRDLIPENMTVEQKLAWVANAEKKGLFGTAKPKSNPNPIGGGTNPAQGLAPDLNKLSVMDMFKAGYGRK